MTTTPLDQPTDSSIPNGLDWDDLIAQTGGSLVDADQGLVDPGFETAAEAFAGDDPINALYEGVLTGGPATAFITPDRLDLMMAEFLNPSTPWGLDPASAAQVIAASCGTCGRMSVAMSMEEISTPAGTGLVAVAQCSNGHTWPYADPSTFISEVG